MVMDSIALPETLELADGGRMEIRPTTAADADRICAVYESLSVDDRRRRFFSAFHPQREWCREWADLGARGGFGVIAIVRRADAADEVAGEAGYAMRADGDGDLAVTVTSRWRGWLGAYLLDVLVRHAGEVGVRNLQAEVLLDNAAMLSLLQRRDPVAMTHDSAMVRLSIGTTGATPTWPPADERRRVLIEVAGRRWSGEEAADRAGLSTVMCAGPAARGEHGCPVLEGGRCPLADGADAIVMLLDPDDERSARLAQAHRQQSPSTPLLVGHRRSGASGDGSPVEGCVEVEQDAAAAVAQVLALIGGSPSRTAEA